MANKAFEIQESKLRIGGVDLEAGTTGVVIPGVTQASNYRVEEVDDTDDQTYQFAPDSEVVVVDAALYNAIVDQVDESHFADYTAPTDDEGYIDDIEVNGRGIYSSAESSAASGNDMYAYVGSASASDRPLVPEDWIQIPFRPKMRAGEVENIGGGGNLEDIIVLGGEGETSLNLANKDFTINTTRTEDQDADINLTAADDIFITALNDDIVLYASDQVRINTDDENHEWIFDANGNLTLPAGGDILDSNGDSVLGGGTSGPQALYITANSDGTVTTSTDGITWTEPFSTGINIGTVAIGPNKIVYTRSDANGDSDTTGLYATPRANTAPTLIAGTDTDQGGDYYWLQVQYFDGTAYPWVAVGFRSAGGANYPTITYSADGESWSYTSIAGDIGTAYADNGTSLSFTDIAYGNGVYVISSLSYNGTGPKGGLWTTTDLTAEIAMANQVAIDDNFKTVEFMSSGGEGITNWAAFNLDAGFWTTTNLDPTVLGDWGQWEPGFIAGLIFNETGLVDQTIEETAAGVINGTDTWMTSSSNGHIVWWPNIPAGPFVSIPQPYTSAISDIVRNEVPGTIAAFTVSPTVSSQNTNWTSIPFDSNVNSGDDTFHIVIDGDGILTTCELVASGVHSVNDTITLFGGAFGGTTGVDDIVITVTDVVAESPTTINFFEGGESGNFDANGEKIVISGVTNVSEQGTTDQSYNGTYYIKQVGSFGGYTYELYTDQALTTPWLTHTYWPVNTDTGTITWSHGEYLDALGYANGHFYVGNDNEQIFRSEFVEGSLTWTKVSDLDNSLMYWNDIAYYSAFSSDTHGSISFSGADIRGAGNISTAGVINLVPNSTLKNAGQYVQIYPTNQFDYPHVHIAAGEDGELYIGNDQQYVKTGIDGTIGISSHDIVHSTTYEWNFGTDGTLTLPSGSELVEAVGGTSYQGGVTITASQFNSYASPGGPGATINGDNSFTNVSWQYVLFTDQALYDAVTAQIGTSNGVFAINWGAGSTLSTGFVLVQFVSGDSFQMCPVVDADGGSNTPVDGTWYFDANFGGTLVSGAAYTAITKSGFAWKFEETGSTVLPGAVVKSTVAKIGGSEGMETALDLTKSINKLTDGYYTLADGAEGQVMYLAAQDGITPSSIGVTVANFRSSGYTGTDGLLFPFRIYNDVDSTYYDSHAFCTMIFTDGAWQQSGGAWD